MAANREQRRKMSKNMGLKPGERIELNAIMVQFTNGKAMYLDMKMVQLIDRVTGEPLFQEVIEGEAADAMPYQAGREAAQSAAQAAEVINADEPQVEIYQVGDKLPENLQHITIPDGHELVVNGTWSGLRPRE